MRIQYYLLTLFFVYTHFIFSQKKPENTYQVYWKNNLKIESSNKEFKLNIGGRIMVDYATFYQNDVLNNQFNDLSATTGTEIRRGRIFTSGTLYSNVNYKFSIDFANDRTSIKDAYIGIKNIPIIGNIRIGHVKEPFRLDALTSSKYITFMERSFAINFQQQRNNGLVFFNDFLNDRISFQTGYFFNEDNSSDDKASNNGYAITSRLTGLLIANKQQKHLAHIGFSYSYRKAASNEFRIESKPEANLSRLKYIFTGPISAVRNIQSVNFETSYLYKSFSLQGEYLISNIHTGLQTPTESYQFHSYYAETSFFVTGENKEYKSSYGGFGRVSPNKNLGKNGYGALELALRYSYSNLNDHDITGGKESNFTAGINWYLNPAVRFMLNGVFATVNTTGKASIIQGRLQIDF